MDFKTPTSPNSINKPETKPIEPIIRTMQKDIEQLSKQAPAPANLPLPPLPKNIEGIQKKYVIDKIDDQKQARIQKEQEERKKKETEEKKQKEERARKEVEEKAEKERKRRKQEEEERKEKEERAQRRAERERQKELAKKQEAEVEVKRKAEKLAHKEEKKRLKEEKVRKKIEEKARRKAEKQAGRQKKKQLKEEKLRNKIENKKRKREQKLARKEEKKRLRNLKKQEKMRKKEEKLLNKIEAKNRKRKEKIARKEEKIRKKIEKKKRKIAEKLARKEEKKRLRDLKKQAGEGRSKLFAFLILIIIVGSAGFLYWWNYVYVYAPLEPIAPISLIPTKETEIIEISAGQKNLLLDKLEEVALKEQEKGALKRILVKLINGEKKYASLSEFTEMAEVKIPSEIMANLKDYTLFVYNPEMDEPEKCQEANIQDIKCSGPRLGLVIQFSDKESLKTQMKEWETTMVDDLRPLILANSTDKTFEFQDDSNPAYAGTDARYKNLPISPVALNHAFFKNLLIIGTSKHSLYQALDTLMEQNTTP